MNVKLISASNRVTISASKLICKVNISYRKQFNLKYFLLLKDSRILYFLLGVVLDSKDLGTKDSFVEIIKF